MSLRQMEKKKFWVLQSKRQLKVSAGSNSGWQRMTSISWQNSSARTQYLLQYFSEMMNSSSLISASLRMRCLRRKKNTTNSSNSIPFPTPPVMISVYRAIRSEQIYPISCFVYYQGNTFPASFSFDMFSRNARRVGVSAHGFSACLAWLKFSCGCERSLSLSWSMRCGCEEEGRLRAEASACSKGTSWCGGMEKMAPACVRSSLSSTWVPVVTLEHLVMDLMSSRMLLRVLPAARCSFSMFPRRRESVLTEALIWSLPSSSCWARLVSSLVRYDVTFCMSP